MSAFMEETPQNLYAPSIMGGYSEKMTSHELGIGFSPDTKWWDFPASRIVRMRYLFFVSHPVFGMVLCQPEYTNTEGSLKLHNSQGQNKFHIPSSPSLLSSRVERQFVQFLKAVSLDLGQNSGSATYQPRQNFSTFSQRLHV